MLQALHDLEAKPRFKPCDSLVHSLVISHARGEFQLLVVLLIIHCKAGLALMRFAHAFIWTAEVLFEEVSPVTAPAFLEQPNPAFANVETEDAEVPMQLRMSVEAPACIVFVVDVGMSKLPMTARDRFGKRIEQAYKEITQRHLEFELTKTVQDVHDRRRDFKDDHVVT